MRLRVGAIASAVLLFTAATATPSSASPLADSSPSCQDSVDWGEVGFDCEILPTPGLVPSPSNPVARVPQPVIEYRPACSYTRLTQLCGRTNCEVDGQPGRYHTHYIDDQYQGTVCLPDPNPDPDPQITPGLIQREFRTLTWPGSELRIQPPGGRTLVNFPTNLYTPDTTPITQTTTLLGHRVTIEATPTTWTWRHGDRTTTTTHHPGRPYPHLDLTHTYQHVETVRVRLDTTYTGRYRIDTGPWHTIPDTHTVTGTPQPLEIIEARPTLVAPSS